MSIIRAPRVQSNFYILDKRISEDRRLSWAARGVLIFLLGKPDHWKVSIQNLINETEEADPHSRRDAIYRILRELEKIGYVSRLQPKRDDGSFAEVDYLVGETGTPLTEIPEAVPLTGLPDTGEPLTADPYLVRTDVVLKIETPDRNEHIPRVSASAKVSIILRKYGINSNPSHPVVLAMAEQGIDLEVLEACCKETREAKPGETIAVSYIAKKLEGWKSQAAQVNVAGVAKKAVRETWFLSAQSMSAKARELGIPDARMGESEAAFKSRIQQAINGRTAA